MKRVIPLLCLLCLGTLIFGQTSNSTWVYFSLEHQIELGSDQSLTLLRDASLPVPLGAGAQVKLVPPDMALVPQDRILRFAQDTLANPSGPSSIISTCWLDTLFIDQGVFLTEVPVQVSYFADGTYEGTSSFGQDLLLEIGEWELSTDQESLIFKEISLANQTPDFRLHKLTQITPGAYFPFQTNDIEEIRLIRASSSLEVDRKIDLLENLLTSQPLFCTQPSTDPQLPPASALARIQAPVTVRYFEPFHAERASALGEGVAYLLGLPPTEVVIEDMLPSYQGQVPVQNYLEVWVK
ncbi:MAG: hypothetical protein AAF804_19050 [Bacteroidota bacterium]